MLASAVLRPASVLPEDCGAKCKLAARRTRCRPGPTGQKKLFERGKLKKTLAYLTSELTGNTGNQAKARPWLHG